MGQPARAVHGHVLAVHCALSALRSKVRSGHSSPVLRKVRVQSREALLFGKSTRRRRQRSRRSQRFHQVQDGGALHGSQQVVGFPRCAEHATSAIHFGGIRARERLPHAAGARARGQMASIPGPAILSFLCPEMALSPPFVAAPAGGAIYALFHLRRRSRGR